MSHLITDSNLLFDKGNTIQDDCHPFTMILATKLLLVNMPKETVANP